MSETLQDRLKAAARGLTVTSETDAPIDVVTLDGLTPNSSPEAIRAALQAEGPIEKVTTEDFFPALTITKPWMTQEARQNAQGMATLHTLLQQELDNLTVYFFGETEKTVFITGTPHDPTTGLIGLKSKVVET